MVSLPADNVYQHTSLQHAIRGVRSSSTLQFRGLKYAHVPARYQESTPNDTLTPGSDGIVDATAFGPSCPQHRGAQAWDLTLLGDVEPPRSRAQGNCIQPEEEKMDEFECLHLNVTVPVEQSLRDGNGGPKKKALLPVFVWVHGGGLSMGSNSWPQYNISNLVARSLEIGQPVIGVAINYRLNIFGFLASRDIGAKGNMGFKDQVLAFRWIKKHIAGFGGDPDKVTAVGESAGAISLSTLLCAAGVGTPGLFERVVLMSGETTLRKPRPQTWQQQLYEEQSTLLHLDPSDPAARREKLLESDAEQLAQQLPLAQHFTPTIDRSWLKTDITLDLLSNTHRAEHKPSWCKEHVVGDSAHDGTVLKTRILDHPHVLERLRDACATYLTPSETNDLLSAYKLHDSGSNATTTKEEQIDRLRALVSELRFYLPTLAVHRGWQNRPSMRYHFHVPNPFPGPFKGLASHELDVAFLLQNFNQQMNEEARAVAQGIADWFIGFANGCGLEGGERKGSEGDARAEARGKAARTKTPSPPTPPILIFSPTGTHHLPASIYDQTYRANRGKLLESIGAHKLWCVAEIWQGVRKDEPEDPEDPEQGRRGNQDREGRGDDDAVQNVQRTARARL